MKAISKIRAEIITAALSSMEEGISIRRNNKSSLDEAFHLGVNWAAFGTEDPDETVRFARNLIELAGVVKEINSMGLTVKRGIEDEIKSEDDYDETYDRLIEALTIRDYEAFIDFARRSTREIAD